MTLRLLSYARVSDVRGREGPGFISPGDQLSRNRSYADAYGHVIVEEGTDLNRSGGDMSRPVFDDFLARIKSGVADGLIVAKLDRFARSNVGALQAIESIEDAGGALISVQEQIDPRSASGRFMRSIFLATAQMERERIGEQWFASRSSAVKRGIHVAPFVPPGYTRGGRTDDASTDRILVPHPQHAETMRRAFAMAAEGASDAEVARYLNDRKLTSFSVKSGERQVNWMSHRIKRLLSNRVYLGEARSGEGVSNGDAHEAIVDETTFMLANSTRRVTRSANQATYLLSGLVRCASCSYAMRAQPARGSTVGAYRCATNSVHGRCPGPSTISMTRLEDHVLELFLTEAEAEPINVSQDPEADTTGLRDLVAASATAERSYRAQLANMDLRRRIGDADHDVLVASLHDEWRAAQRLVDDSRPVRVARLEAEGLRDAVAALRAAGDVTDLRELLDSSVEAIFVRPAVSRAHNLPVSDRVKVLFSGDADLVLPRRGERFTPARFDW